MTGIFPSFSRSIKLLFAFLTILMAACVSNSSKDEKLQSQRLYWRVYPKSDNTFYLIPRPELTTEFPTAERINSLSKSDAETMAQKLNATLQFTVEKSNEGGTLMTRVVPEPLLEDIILVCKKKPTHPLLQARCKKELAWREQGARPDIYMKLSECEAVALAQALNTLYNRKQVSSDSCPQADQVAK